MGYVGILKIKFCFRCFCLNKKQGHNFEKTLFLPRFEGGIKFRQIVFPALTRRGNNVHSVEYSLQNSSGIALVRNDEYRGTNDDKAGFAKLDMKMIAGIEEFQVITTFNVVRF